MESKSNDKKIQCECGRLVRKSNIKRHQQTPIHFKKLKEKKQNENKQTETETKQTETETKQTETKQTDMKNDTYFDECVRVCLESRKRSTIYKTHNPDIKYTEKISKEGYMRGTRYVNPWYIVIDLQTNTEREENKVERERRLHRERTKRSRDKKKEKIKQNEKK